MRLLVTADLHYNHPRSRPLADELIDQMNRTGGDVLLVVGDTATADGPLLEQCLARFEFAGPRLIVAGNHELWTHRGDSYTIFTDELPRRVRNLGWHWLETTPFIAGHLAIVGSVGWYDYAFAPASLGIPRRFYEHKVSPGAAAHLPEHADLLQRDDDLTASARSVVARWNDGRFVKLGRTDQQFLDELLQRLARHLDALPPSVTTAVAAIHHLPFAQLLPPPHTDQWDFAKAYLGSPRIGELLLQHPRVQHVFCGHSHLPGEARIGHLHAINVGSGYRQKRFCTLDVRDS